jgi:hypothetical protein
MEKDYFMKTSFLHMSTPSTIINTTCASTSLPARKWVTQPRVGIPENPVQLIRSQAEPMVRLSAPIEWTVNKSE